MYMLLKDRILDNGTYQINFERTREPENGSTKPTCLDMGFTNHKEKIMSIKTQYPTFSDHALVEFNRTSKRMEFKKTYRKARSFENFNRENFSQDLLDHYLYIPNLYEKEPKNIATNLTSARNQLI